MIWISTTINDFINLKIIWFESVDIACWSSTISNALVNICYGDVYEWNKNWTGFRAKNWQDIKQFLMKGENKTIDDESRVSAAVT